MEKLLWWNELENLASPLWSAVELLEPFDPGDSGLRVYRDKALEFVQVNPEPFARSNRLAHLTASAVVIEPQSRRSLMVFHPYFKRWQQPGGHADGDPDLVRVALKEAIEETGISELGIVPKVIDVGFGRGEGNIPHTHFDIRFVAIAPATSMDAVSPEGIELRWFGADERGEELDLVRRRMLRSALELVRGRGM